MEFRKLSRAYLAQAGDRIASARRALKGGNYAYCVRLSQEAVELSTKALLRRIGVDYPKFHDTSPALLALKKRLQINDLQFLAEVSLKLSRRRALAMYGDESRNLSPDEIFGREEALEAYQLATRVHQSCTRLVTRRLGSKGGGATKPSYLSSSG